jgi:hypothetical protein
MREASLRQLHSGPVWFGRTRRERLKFLGGCLFILFTAWFVTVFCFGLDPADASARQRGSCDPFVMKASTGGAEAPSSTVDFELGRHAVTVTSQLTIPYPANSRNRIKLIEQVHGKKRTLMQSKLGVMQYSDQNADGSFAGSGTSTTSLRIPGKTINRLVRHNRNAWIRVVHRMYKMSGEGDQVATYKPELKYAVPCG